MSVFLGAVHTNLSSTMETQICDITIESLAKLCNKRKVYKGDAKKIQGRF